MLAALADIFKAVGPLVSGVMGWLGKRRARKEGREEALREVRDRDRARGNAFSERRREMEKESEERFLEEKRKVMKEGAGTHEDRFAAFDRKVNYKS